MPPENVPNTPVQNKKEFKELEQFLENKENKLYMVTVREIK